MHPSLQIEAEMYLISRDHFGKPGRQLRDQGRQKEKNGKNRDGCIKNKSPF
jgi:hypothetical protein